MALWGEMTEDPSTDLTSRCHCGVIPSQGAEPVRGQLMPQTIELPDELADALTDEASRAGMSLPDYAVHILSAVRPPVTAVRTGADLVAFWQAQGLLGPRAGDADSPEEARRLRDQAQRRGG